MVNYMEIKATTRDVNNVLGLYYGHVKFDKVAVFFWSLRNPHQNKNSGSKKTTLGLYVRCI